MAIQLIRKSDTVKLVVTTDEAVTLPEGTPRNPPQWVEAAEHPHAADATVVTVRPLDALEVGSLSDLTYAQKCLRAVPLALVSVSGIEDRDEAVAAIPYPLAVHLGERILLYSLGDSDPFVLVGSEPPSGSTPSGIKGSKSASTKAAGKSARKQKATG